MDIVYAKEKIEFKKELNNLDEFTIEFTSVLNKLNITYVIVSGYVSILFGRNRASEDIDIIVDKININKFRDLWNNLSQFECLEHTKFEDAYEYIINGTAIRFSRKNKFIPNIEFKFPKKDLEEWVLKNRIKVDINNKTIFISPIELQIAFKIYLGSEKDIEDARYLYGLFKDKIDIRLLGEFNQKLKITKKFNIYIK